MRIRSLLLAVCLLAAISSVVSCADDLRNREKQLLPSAQTKEVPQHEVLELSFRHNGDYENKFSDVDIGAVFTSPSGKNYHITGFYREGEIWSIRFRPDETGGWAYRYAMAGKGGFHGEGKGYFKCIPGEEDGPVVPNPANKYRWVFLGGKPFFPVGIQDCVFFDGKQLGAMPIDGEMRDEDGASMLSADEYFSLYGKSGFNLFRFSQKNCSYDLYDDLDNYRLKESLATDDLMRIARANEFRVMFGIFGYFYPSEESGRLMRLYRRAQNAVLGRDSRKPVSATSQSITAREKRFIDYCVARWGAYVDFWELLNERKATDRWTVTMAEYLRSIDPYRRPISTSWEKPHLEAIDINSPHWYESEDELESDVRVHQMASQWKETGKTVLVGEQGNTGMNWDERSGVRMRIRAWTALFEEIGLIFWNTSWARNGMFQGQYTAGRAANIYLGPEERAYVRILQDFSSRLDARVVSHPVEISVQDQVRGYGLASEKVAAAYLHHFENHETEVADVKMLLDVPSPVSAHAEYEGRWIEPATGKILERIEVVPGRQWLRVPPFAVDAALIVTIRADG